MKILFLAPRMPLPADTGGKIRTLNILKQLALRHDVHLICFSFEPIDASYVKDLQSLGITTTLVPASPLALWQKAMLILLSSTPVSITAYTTPPMRRAIEEALSAGSVDAVHVDHLHMAVYLPMFGHIPVFIDEHNVEYRILERCAAVEPSSFKKWVYQDQSTKMRRLEMSLVRTAKALFACSADDRLALSRLTAGLVPIHIVTNGVDTEYFADDRTDALEDAVVFTGSMDWVPNDDAITYFCHDILPLIWRMNDRVKVYVVGKNPSAAVRTLAQRDQRVVVTGRVDDVRTYVARAKVFIVPLRIGGGTRLKILEAMAMAKAVVSTSIGAEGIECRHGTDITLADKPATFAKAVVDLFNDPERMQALGQAGRMLVRTKYDWRIVGETLNGVYQGVDHGA